MRLENFNWSSGLFIIIYHLALLIALPIYISHRTPQAGLILASLILLFLSGISISAGYHRFYAHKSYNASKIVEVVLLFFATMALEGSVLRWSSQHRLHHRFTDKEQDPYPIKKGFLYAHILWIFEKYRPIDMTVVPDLVKNKIVMFQNRHYALLGTLTNIVSTLFIWWLTGDIFGSIVISLIARIFLLHHLTFFINSLAHTWGARTYSGEQTAVDNYIIALLTFGEGYHNYHHVFTSDYRNGVKWYHFDPGKWLVWILSKLRLTGGLRKMDQYFIKKTIIRKDKAILLEKLRECKYLQKESFENKVNKMSEKIMLKLSELSRLSHEYAQSRHRTIRKQMREFKKGLNGLWREWGSLSRQVMSFS